MAQISVTEKRTIKHDASIKGKLVLDGELKVVQVNDYGEVIAEKSLVDALENFLGTDVKITVSELEPDVEEIPHDVNYLIEA